MGKMGKTELTQRKKKERQKPMRSLLPKKLLLGKE